MASHRHLCDHGWCIYVQSCFLYSLLAALLTLTYFCLYKTFHPLHPEVYVEATSLSGFHLGAGSNDSLPYDLALNVSFARPQHGSYNDEFCYNVIEGRAYHSVHELGYDRLPAFCQLLRNPAFVSLTFEGRPVLHRGLAERLGWFVGDLMIHVQGRFAHYSAKRKEYIQGPLIDGVAECKVEAPLPSLGKNFSRWAQRIRCHERFHRI